MAMEQAREDWARLASYVISARTAAGFATRGDLENATGITARTIGKLETGHRVSPETLAAVARVLGWTADSPSRILAGREPVTAGVSPAPPRALRPDVVYTEGGVEEEFLASVLALLSPEDQEVVRGVMRMVDGEGRPWSWERKRALIEAYVARNAQRRPAAG